MFIQVQEHRTYCTYKILSGVHKESKRLYSEALDRTISTPWHQNEGDLNQMKEGGEKRAKDRAIPLALLRPQATQTQTSPDLSSPLVAMISSACCTCPEIIVGVLFFPSCCSCSVCSLNTTKAWSCQTPLFCNVIYPHFMLNMLNVCASMRQCFYVCFSQSHFRFLLQSYAPLRLLVHWFKQVWYFQSA